MSGRGRLTEKVIDSIQNYYGRAIRDNIDNIYAIKKAIWAIHFHCTEFDDQAYRHIMCPRDENSWCKYYSKQDDTNYKEKISLSEEIFNVLKPLFTDCRKRSC